MKIKFTSFTFIIHVLDVIVHNLSSDAHFSKDQEEKIIKTDMAGRKCFNNDNYRDIIFFITRVR